MAAAAEEAVAAAERLQLEERLAELAKETQQLQAQLGVAPPAAAAPQPEAEESQCVVCMDASTSHAVLPCMHKCVCAACAQQLQEQGTSCCPICRTPIERIAQVLTP